METSTTDKKFWSPCPHCRGLGTVVRGPSKKRRRQHEQAMADLLKTRSAQSAAPPLSDNVDICLACEGSGLQCADALVPIDANTYPQLAIVGGGIGGMALAVACQHRGIPVTLFERDSSFSARSQGYGLTLQQASKAIAGLGITSLADGVISTRHVVHNPEGAVIGEWGLRKWKKPQSDTSRKRRNIHIARQALRSALFEQLTDSSVVKWGHDLRELTNNDAGGVDLTFQVEEEAQVVQADLAVGADGIRGRVRQSVLPESTAPLQYLGCMVVLGICPLEALVALQSPLLDSATVFQTVNGHERLYVMPYNHDTVMWQFSVPMTEAAATALSKQGSTAMKQEVIQRLSQWHEPVPALLAATPEMTITGYPVYDRSPLDPSSLQAAGATTLLGDAVHPMSPFKGQGANQALLDALALARSITETCGSDSDWRTAGLRTTVLRSFEADMLARTRSKVLDSKKAVELLHSDAVLHDGDEPRGRGIGG